MNKNVEISNSKPDLIEQFCRNVVIRFKDKWPIPEELLAKEFFEFFHFPIFASSQCISEFSRNIDVELIQEEIAEDVFGVNFCFNKKRIIVLCNRKDRHITRAHTYLHEIRELLESEFQLLGFPSVTTEDKEDRADDFAEAVSLIPIERGFAYLMERSAKLDRLWKRIGAVIGVGFLQMMMIMVVHYCAIYPQIEAFKPRNRSNNVT